MSSQTIGYPFPMPFIVAMICMEALGSPNWVNPISQPRLNLYTRLQTGKEERDREAFRSGGNNASCYTTIDISSPIHFTISKEEVLESLQEEIERKHQEIANNVQEIHKLMIIPKLATLNTQLVAKRILLDEGYQELAKETTFQRQMRSMQLTQQAKGLIIKAENILDDTLQFTESKRPEVEELSQPTRELISLTQDMRQTRAKLACLSERRARTKIILYQPLFAMPSLLAKTSTQVPSSAGLEPSEGQAPSILLPSLEMSVPNSSRGKKTPPTIDIERVGTTNVGPYLEAFVSSSPLHEVVPRPSGREGIPRSSQIATSLLDSTLIEEALIPLQQGSVEQLLESGRPLMDHIEIRGALTLRQEPIKTIAPEPVLLVQCDSPISGTERVELEKEYPETVVGDATTSSSIPKAHHSKRKNPPSLGGPARDSPSSIFKLSLNLSSQFSLATVSRGLALPTY
eukprot:Gb_04933 [translate_table: standard]